MPNSSSSAITSSTVSNESAPKSATKAFSDVTWDVSLKGLWLEVRDFSRADETA